MATISSSGVGSGLDVSALVTQLVAAERAPYDTRIARAETKVTTQVSALGRLKSALSTFQSALTGLKDATSFQKRDVSISDISVLTATATTQAASGSYEIEVSQLAKSSQLASNPFVAGSTAAVGTGTLQLTMGARSFSVAIDDAHKTLAGVRDAINAATDNPGVRATLIKAQDGTRLVLTGSATGTANAVKVTASGGDGGLAQITYDPPGSTALHVVNPAQDAIVMVSGYEVHSASNTVSDAIEGVTLALRSEDVDKTATLTIADDTASVKSLAQNFVTAYNALAGQMATLRSYDASTQTAGPLLGDAMLLGIESQVRRAISDPASGLTGAYTTLASLGIATTTAGTLALDGTKFDAALAADPAAVSRVFSSTGGVAARLDKLLTAHLATDGDVAARVASNTAKTKELTRQKEALEARMVLVQERYTKQFNALDTLLTQMQSTSKYLAQQLSSSSSSSSG
jgi:flagellar hook-associated protein 2